MTLPHNIDETFLFFSDAFNLERITPPELRFSIVTPEPIEVKKGTQIDYRLRLWRIPFTWTTLITHWDPPHGFVDEQKKGPYKTWIHSHRFTEGSNETHIADEVIYEMPFWPFGEIISPFIFKQISRIFHHRKSTIKNIFKNGANVQVEHTS